MDEFLSLLPPNALRSAESAFIMRGAASAFSLFALVASRLAGLAVFGPLFSHPQIPLKIRLLFVLAMSFVITPAIWGTNPDSIVSATHASESSLEFVALMGLECCVGFALGLGVSTLLSGLHLAGALIDQQLGTSVSTVFNPQSQSEVPLSGELLYQLGIVVFLVVGGHYLMISTLVDSFEALPIGKAWISADLVDLLSSFVHQSLLLAVKVSAPVTATLALVTLGLGLLGHSLPQLNVMVVGFPVRALLGLFVFGLALSPMAEMLSQWLPDGMEQLRHTLTGEAE